MSFAADTRPVYTGGFFKFFLFLKKEKNLWQETIPVRLHKERARAKGKQVALVHYDDDVVYILICVFSSLSHLFRSFFFF